MTKKKQALDTARRATTRARQSRQTRDDAIRRATEVASYSEVAGAVGLSKARIQKIIEEGRAAQGG